jgi:hypothetical protein
MGSGKVRCGLLFVILSTGTVEAMGKDIYVSPSGNDQNNGNSSATPLRTIAAASSRAVAGDNVYLLAGQYTESIVPVNSGTAGNPITYKSFGSGAAVISNVPVGISVSSRAYIIFDGINVDGKIPPPNSTVSEFVAIQNSNNIVVRHGSFRYANGWAGIDVTGLYSPDGRFYGSVAKSSLVSGTTSYVTIEDNVLDGVGNYAVPSGDVIQVSNGTNQHVLVQRNTATHGGHDLIEFDADYGVVQDNVLNNSFGDVVSGDTGYRSVEVRGSFDVIQRNVMLHARLGAAGSRVGPLASIRGNQNIARNNLMVDGMGVGNVTWCGPDNATVTNGRIYNNTFYQLGSAAWTLWAYDGCSATGSFVFANNLVAESRMAPGTMSGVSNGGTNVDADLEFVPGSVGIGPTAQSVVKGNLFAPHGGGPAYVIFIGADGRVPLSAAATKYPQFFISNIEARPVFMKANPSVPTDFQLQSNSAGTGAGVFLTNVVGNGTSNRVVLKDSLYFTDGNALIPGDTIQLQGSNQQATIISIDRSSNTLTLSANVTFKDGQGVSLPYNGAAPDIGAGAFKSAIRPLPPGSVNIEH